MIAPKSDNGSNLQRTLSLLQPPKSFVAGRQRRGQIEFRGTGITEYLRNGGDLEVAAWIAGHESTRTTQLYNQIHEEISLDEIERIHI